MKEIARSFIIIILIISQSLVTSKEIICGLSRYKSSGMSEFLTTCQDRVFEDLKDINITSKDDRFITKVNGLTNEMRGVYFNLVNVHYFPQNLEKFISIVEGIKIKACGLKEITQNDLKPFGDLKYLHLPLNEIQELEANLFAFNSKLEVVDFSNNKIKKIHARVFDDLKGLRVLDLDLNQCILRGYARTKNEIGRLIEEVKEKC